MIEKSFSMHIVGMVEAALNNLLGEETIPSVQMTNQRSFMNSSQIYTSLRHVSTGRYVTLNAHAANNGSLGVTLYRTEKSYNWDMGITVGHGGNAIVEEMSALPSYVCFFEIADLQSLDIETQTDPNIKIVAQIIVDFFTTDVFPDMDKLAAEHTSLRNSYLKHDLPATAAIVEGA